MMIARRAGTVAIAALAVALAGTLATVAVAPAQALKIGQAAPPISGAPWVNSAPLSLEGLRGRVVMVEFWTYG